MLTHEENELLCRVEGDAPMGGIFRQHWMPACLVEEVAEPDCDPVRVRILGENLVCFRDSDGRLGLIDEQCPHRRASLALGRNEECGLRCLYHGWKFDVDGNCVDMAAEPPGSELPSKVKIKSYPVHEHAGVVFTYLGECDGKPEFTPPCWAPQTDTKVAMLKMHVPCNWAQALEGSIDSSHSSSLHSSDFVPARIAGAGADSSLWYRPSTDKSPRMESQQTPFGFRYAAIRKPIKDAATHDYIRTTLFLAPYTALIPSNNMYHVSTIHVPIDDENTMFYFAAFGTETTPSDLEWRKFAGTLPGIDLDENWRPIRNWDNNYLQDRQAMKLGNFTGIKGFINQDMAMWIGMGPIADRSQEKLGASDLAVVEFRRIMLEAVKNFQNGEPAIGTGPNAIPHASLRSFEGIVEKGTDWRRLNVGELELKMMDKAAKDASKAAE